MEIIAFTGAGISKSSGIPTFDEQPEIREKLSRQYAEQYPESYNKTIKSLKKMIEKAEPNDAHYALAEYNIPIITMNIDGLHQKAGSTDVVEIHGSLPKIVLYGDSAPMYRVAHQKLATLPYKKYVFLVVGTSFYTGVSKDLLHKAKQRAKQIIIINENAETQVRQILKHFAK